jgi:predicted nucleic acid-binding protein
MIVVDSGVWSDYFTGKQTCEVESLDVLLGQHPIGTSELIYTDVLKGFAADQDFDIAKKLFALLTELKMVDANIAVKGADYARHLRKLGISIRNTAELIIATYCIENNYPLLYSSPNFTHFENHLNLKNALNLKA